MISFVGPLVFVIAITMTKEWWDDKKRADRDRELNETIYEKLNLFAGKIEKVQAQHIKVGDLIRVHSNQRVPSDIVLLFTTEAARSVFIRTDQLDGETDWKLRRPATMTQNKILDLIDIAHFSHAEVLCEEPS